MNISIPSKKCPSPTIHEQQVSFMCGKHAINNVLQRKEATCSSLAKTARTLSKNMNIQLNELMNPNTGYYDASVLVHYLVSRGYDIDVLYPKDFFKMSRRQSPRLLGYIFGDGTHWMSVRKTFKRGCYFEIDSLLDNPRKLSVLKRWIQSQKPIKFLAIRVLRARQTNVSIK
jgi:hypothetical protein